MPVVGETPFSVRVICANVEQPKQPEGAQGAVRRLQQLWRDRAAHRGGLHDGPIVVAGHQHLEAAGARSLALFLGLLSSLR